MFISKEEMNRTLGVKAELNYIELGKINTYSTKFHYRVMANIDYVSFTWNSIGRVEYKVRVESDDSSVLPIIRIPLEGRVPNSLQEFSVEYRCAGHRSGQFTISLFFDFQYESEHLQIKLRQEKICASRDGRRGLTGGYEGNEILDEDDSIDRAFFVIICIAAAFLLIVAAMLICYFKKSKKEDLIPSRIPVAMDDMRRRFKTDSPCKIQTTETRFSENIMISYFGMLILTVMASSDALTAVRSKRAIAGSNPAWGISTPRRASTSFRNSLKSTKSAQPFLLSSTSAKDGPPTMSAVSSAPCSSSSVNSIIPDKPRNIDVRRALLQLYQDRELFQPLPFVDMEGTFGEVKFAIWRQPDDLLNGDVDDEEDALCNQEAVYTKVLKKNASPAHLDRFLSEALIFHNIQPHLNIAQIAAIATFGRFDRPETVKDFPMVCYRHQGFGNLKKFLANCRHGDKTKGAQTLRTHQLVSMATQVSSGVAHLHKYRIIHNDIAARNCIVAEVNNRLHVQLCDSALSKDIFPMDYHCLGDNENRPLKWMAPEAIASGLYSSAADVWSLGVLIWEMMSLGCSPFAEVDPEDVYSLIVSGARLNQPNNCPDQLYKVMLCCWRSLCDERPTGEQVVNGLREFNVQLSQYI